MKKIFVFALVAAFAVTAQAQMLQEGTQEVIISVGQLDFEGPNGATIDLGGGYGYFIQDNLEVGALVNWFDDGDDAQQYGLSFFGEYNFAQWMADSMFVPAVGLTAGWIHAKNTEIGGYIDEDAEGDAFEVTLRPAIKYFLSEVVSIDLGVYASWATDDMYNNDGDVEDTDFGMDWTLRAYF